jgi:hypothetical protein
VDRSAQRASHGHDEGRADSSRRRGATIVTAHPIGNPKGTSVADVARARGGLSAWSVLSGILVAFGAFVVLNLVVGSVLAASDLIDGGLSPQTVRDAGIAAAVGLVLVQFVAYFWGGYTAGRMARGSGWVNGLMVAVGALIFIALVAAAVGGVAGWGWARDAGFETLPFSMGEWTEAATALGAALIVSMLLGGVIGGRIGSTWHTKLENTQLPRLIR